MRKFIINIFTFIAFLSTICLILLVIDRFVFDKISNQYLNEVLKQEKTKDIIIVGSSQMKWATINTSLPSVTFLSEGGQYAFGVAGVLFRLEKKGLLENKTVILNLVDADENSNGNGQWWYYSEVFIWTGLAKLTDYSINDYPNIIARIVRDIIHFTPNAYKQFKWVGLDKARGRHPIEPIYSDISAKKEAFISNQTPISSRYSSFLKRFIVYIEQLEEQNSANFFIALPPYPKASRKTLENIFGSERIIDLSTSPNYKLEDFYDNGHLNSQGARKLTEELKHTLKTKGIYIIEH